MENNSQNQGQQMAPKKSSKSVIATIAVIIVILLIVAFSFGKGKHGDMTAGTASSTMATSTASSTPAVTPVVSNASSTSTAPSILPPSLIYSIFTDKKSYSQNDQIVMTISVLNNTNQSKTFSFVNGCQGDYTIAGFNLDQHIRCTPAPTSFTVPPQETESIKLVHYPSVYKLPVGTWPLSVEIIGYGGVTIPALTITP